MSNNELKLLEIAKELMIIDPNLALTGSLMLAFRGIIKRREAVDIDFIMKNDYASKYEVPSGCISTIGSDGCSNSFEYRGIKVDILSSGEDVEVIDNILCSSVDKLLEVKYCYSCQNNESADKHRLDLEFMGVYEKYQKQHEENISSIIDFL